MARGLVRLQEIVAVQEELSHICSALVPEPFHISELLRLSAQVFRLHQPPCRSEAVQRGGLATCTVQYPKIRNLRRTMVHEKVSSTMATART